MSLPNDPSKLAERVYMLWQLQIIMGTLHDGIDFTTPLMEAVTSQSAYDFDVFKHRLYDLMEDGFREEED